MNLEFFSQNPELLWIFTVFYDLTLAIILFYFFGKNGLYTAVILGIILANLQGGKVSELTIFWKHICSKYGSDNVFRNILRNRFIE